MGGTTIGMRVKGNEAALRKAYKKKCDEDSRYYGTNPYSGSFATFHGELQIRQTIFNCIEEASNYIDEHHIKYDGAIAVRFKVFKENKTIEKLKADIWDLTQQLWNRELTSRKRNSLERKKAEKEAKLSDWRTKLGDKAKRTEWLVGGVAAT